MRAWALLLGGLAIWAAHLLGVYAFASLGAVVAEPDHMLVRILVGALTLACLAADAAILRIALTRPSTDGLARFLRLGAALGAALSVVAVLWQGLPATVGH